jgi:hypothetical protein
VNWLDRTKLHTLTLHDANLKDKTFYIPDFSDSVALRKSIERVGILNRPVVQENAEKGIIPVLGRRRLEAGQFMGLEKVEVLVLPSEMPSSDGYRLAFWDNVAQRRFDVATTAVVLTRLLDLFAIEIVATEFLEALGVPPRGPRLERLRALGTLEHRALEWMAAGRIQEKTGVVLTRLDAENRARVMDLIETLGMNANKNAELVGNLFDLSLFHGKPMSDLILDESMQSILSDTELPVSEKGAHVRELVKSWKYPEFSEKERLFQEWYAKLPDTPHVKMRPAQAFETEECIIEIRVPNRVEAQRVLEILNAL